jgi:hypothetical protein
MFREQCPQSNCIKLGLMPLWYASWQLVPSTLDEMNSENEARNCCTLIAEAYKPNTTRSG